MVKVNKVSKKNRTSKKQYSKNSKKQYSKHSKKNKMKKTMLISIEHKSKPHQDYFYEKSPPLFSDVTKQGG